MKKKIPAFVITIFSAMLLLTGCFSGGPGPDKTPAKPSTQWVPSQKQTASPAATEDSAEKDSPAPASPAVVPAAPVQGKNVIWEIKNVSGTSYILTGEVDPDDMPDAYGISDFAVAAGSSVKEGLYENDTYLASGQLIETSPKTYEIVITFVWCSMPTDKDEIEMDQTEGPFDTQALKIMGTYNEYAVIEFDGALFKQIIG